jgi:hypothetical protein
MFRPEDFAELTTPSAPLLNGTIFDGAATPPLQGGECAPVRPYVNAISKRNPGLLLENVHRRLRHLLILMGHHAADTNRSDQLAIGHHRQSAL